MTGREPLRELARLLDSIDAAARDRTALDGVLSALTGIKAPRFDGAVLFKCGYGGGPFVLQSSNGFDRRLARGWMRWPLRRLFVRMKPSLIFDPLGSDSVALAIPFSYGTERYLVLSPLAASKVTTPCRDFLRALESITVPAVSADRQTALEIPVTPVDPAVVGLALCGELLDRIAPPLQRRGWPLEQLHTFGDLWRRLEEGVPDIVAIDADELMHPLAALASIHRAADSAALRV
ncbi:MAG: hypothetical protein JO104_08455, partial [Candidatus Eremiobacteraeota bacterium]|nr:hypothetical protein [Candidatus Eremiobacteraeota bacterium]